MKHTNGGMGGRNAQTGRGETKCTNKILSCYGRMKGHTHRHKEVHKEVVAT